MKKYIITVIFFTSMLFSQSIIPQNFDLDLIKEQLKSTPNQLEEISNSEIEQEEISIEESEESQLVKDDISSQYYGYEYFSRDINFFDNIPTPSNFRLGSGDEIILSLWGEKNSREKFIINKEGLIYYKNIGFINLSNKTLDEAEQLLVSKLSNIYSTLEEDKKSTELMLELGKLKSLNIYFSGGIKNPGIHLIHPFSDVFSAIVQAGGVELEGSLRNIQIIRNSNIIQNIDFYDFFTKGSDNFSNIKLIDGDIIHIPDVTRRIFIDGQINRVGFYEVLEGESLASLVVHASGFTAEASSSIMIKTIIPLEKRISDDNARSSINVNFKDIESIFLNNGDAVNVNAIGDVSSTVDIFGRVKNPGSYSAINSSLKDILDIAGGFDDQIYRKTIRDDDIVVLRKDEKQFYGLEFHLNYNESGSFPLKPEDQIFVYEDNNYDNIFSIEVSGEVKKRGKFQLKKGMNIADAIKLAEGFTELANPNGIIVTERFTSLDDAGNEITELNQVNDASLDFIITDGSVINVLPLENVVNIQGNVYDPGLVVYSGKKSVDKYINLAGGPKPNTLKNRIYVKRANGRTKKVSLLRGLGINVKPGDTIFVPVDENPSDFNVAAFTADILSVLSNLVAILAIVDNNSD